MITALECRTLTVSFGSVLALDRVDLTVEPGEALAVLGPSGSGKTTLLYTVAGFVVPQAGEVFIGGVPASGPGVDVAPEKRKVGMVFQHYALWPHLTALATVAYPLRRRGMGRAEAEMRARDLLARMEIDHLADRKPAEMSGGQQQRVGLARALARNAVLFLFDEPTAHLDSALRQAVQEEIAQRRTETGASALYATHDAAEALAVADRVALLRAGKIVQVGSPLSIYEQPVDLWAALLTGPAAVMETPVVASSPGQVIVEIGGERVTVAGGPTVNGSGRLLVRPEWSELGGSLPGMVRRLWYRGPHTDYRLDTPIGEIDIRSPGPPSCRPGDRTGWQLNRVWVLSD